MGRWDNPLHDRLLDWGAALSGRNELRAAIARDTAPDVHPLQRARAFAPGTRRRAALRIAGRDGSSRRRLMARELEVCGVRMVPMGYVDPVPGTPTRSPGPRAAVDAGMTPEARAVDQAVRALWRRYPLQAAVLRQEYAGVGPREERAARLQVSVRAYREQLRLARAAVALLLDEEGARSVK